VDRYVLLFALTVNCLPLNCLPSTNSKGIAIDPATVENGTLHLVPRAHLRTSLGETVKGVMRHRVDSDSNHLITCVDSLTEEDLASAVPAVLSPGSVVFFCYGTPHCTLDNASDSERTGVAFHFLRSDTTVAKGHAPAICRKLDGPEADGGLKQYGVDQTGKFAEEVDRVLCCVDAGEALPVLESPFFDAYMKSKWRKQKAVKR
jgi:hypothetical protein